MDKEVFIQDYIDKMVKTLNKQGSLIIGYDYDDTVVATNDFSKKYVSDVRKVLRRLNATGYCRFIMITCREGEKLKEAEKFIWQHGLPYNAINANLPWSIPDDPRKVYVNVMIDDKCGIPTSLELLNRLAEHLEN